MRVIDLFAQTNYDIENAKRHEEFLHVFFELNNLGSESYEQNER